MALSNNPLLIDLQFLGFLSTKFTNEMKAYEDSITSEVNTAITAVTQKIQEVGQIEQYAKLEDISANYVKKVDGKDLFSGKYADIIGRPTNVSAFTNDAHYMTQDLASSMFVGREDGKELFSGDYNDLENAPTNVSAFNNDVNYVKKVDADETYVSKNGTFDYSKLVNAPTDISAFTNDLLYLTQDSADGRYQAKSSAFDGNYNSLSNKPSNLSEFNNDEGFITLSSIGSFVTKTVADSTYLSKLDAVANYLSKDDASTSYLSISTGLSKVDYIEQTQQTTINMLSNNMVDKSVKGIDIVCASDGSFIGNGTATDTITLAFNTNLTGYAGAVPIEKGTYTYSGCQKGGSADTFCLAIDFYTDSTTASTQYIDIGNGYTFTVTNDTSRILAYIIIKKNAVLSNAKFSPMLERGSIKHDYVKNELFTNIRDLLTTGVKSVTDGNCINICKNVATISAGAGVSWYKDINGKIHTSGTATGDVIIYLTSTGNTWDLSLPILSNKIYTLSGCAAGGSGSKYHLRVALYDSSSATAVGIAECGNGVKFLSRNAQRFSMYIYIKSGAVMDGLIFAPMLELGSIQHDYIPYTGYSSMQALSDAFRTSIAAKTVNLLDFRQAINVAAANSNGIRFMVGDNGVIQVYGTATDDVEYTIYNGPTPLGINEVYTMSGCPSGGSASTYQMCIYYDNMNPGDQYMGSAIPTDIGSGMQFMPLTTANIKVTIKIKSGTVLPMATYFYPMIEYGSVKHSFVKNTMYGTDIQGILSDLSDEIHSRISNVVNLSNIFQQNSLVYNGVTFRRYPDIITLAGTPTTSISQNIGNFTISKKGLYTLSGYPLAYGNTALGGSGAGYMYVVAQDGTGNIKASDNGTGNKMFLVPGVYTICIVCVANIPQDGITIRPMVESGPIIHDYVPPLGFDNFSMAYQNIKYGALNSVVNLAMTTLYSSSSNSVTAARDSKGKYTINGTASADLGFSLMGSFSKYISLIPGAAYVLSGCPSGGDSLKFYIQIFKYDGSTETPVASHRGNSGTVDENKFIAEAGYTYGIKIFVKSGITMSNVVFAPMLEMGKVIHSFVPPMVNQTLAEEVYSKFSTLIVTALPTVGEPNIIYLIRNASNTSPLYDKYIWINGAYEVFSSGGGSGNIQYGTDVPTTLTSGEIFLVYAE